MDTHLPASSLQRHSVAISGIKLSFLIYQFLWIQNLLLICGLNKGFNSKFLQGYRQQKKTPEEGRSRVGWGNRIHQLHLCRGVHANECLGYDTKQLNGEASIMPELWGIQGTPSFPSTPSSFWPKMHLIESYLWGKYLTFKPYANKRLMLNWIVRNRTVWSFRCV